ncbi:sensor domain-containing diguanylate cyclase [Microvirga calopogonii]|uniref:sensor domain-containing diguanylate cyclase n=1 Tax=Microvirga calopogonii TaxID=2078013 RepID=UPI000E0D9EB4|nr:sensor domain-containing diguanylate cyclase [Microvirga calopogonii]
MSHFVSKLDDETLRHLVEALDESGQAVSIYDADDNLRYANKTYQSMFLEGYEGPFTFTEILRYGARNGVGVRIDGGDVEALIARTLPRRRSVPRKSFESDLLDGRWFWIDHTILPNGWLLTVAAHITSLKHNEKTLRQAHNAAVHASQTDLLTGLPNRRHILELLDEALAAGATSGSSLCVTMIDIDRFKNINDTHGHDAGDAVLRHFASVSREKLGTHGFIGRMGGEEFLVILPNTSLIDAARLIQQVRQECAGGVPWNGQAARSYSFSAGLVEAQPGDDRSTILNRADRALYTAKRQGRNRTKLGLRQENSADSAGA